MSLKTDELKEYWHHIHQFCVKMEIAITGGHTGFSDTGSTTLSGAVTMMAEVEVPKAKSTAFVKPNQDLILTKSAALSSAAVLSKSFPRHTARHLGEKLQQELAKSLSQ